MEADRVWRFAEFAARLGLDSLSGGIRWERSGKMVSNQARENNEEMQREPLIFQHLREEAPNPKQIEFFTAKESMFAMAEPGAAANPGDAAAFCAAGNQLPWVEAAAAAPDHAGATA